MKQAFKIAAIESQFGSEKISTKELRKKFISEQLPEVQLNYMVDNVLGKETLYHMGESESILTLSVAATQKALEKAKMKSTDIDGIIFAGVTAEYYSPTTAIVLSDRLGCRNNLKCCIDSNANCITLTTVLYQANAMMLADEDINTLLLVAGNYMSGMFPETDAASMCCVSDSATALIITRREELTDMCFESYQNPKLYDAAPAPHEGLSAFLRSKNFDDYLLVTNYDMDCEIGLVSKIIKKFFEKHHLSDIKAYCFSQFVYENVLVLSEELELDEDLVPYVGYQYGYTGPSSPFLALKSKIDAGEVKPGDRIFVWTLATGTQHVFCSFIL